MSQQTALFGPDELEPLDASRRLMGMLDRWIAQHPDDWAVLPPQLPEWDLQGVSAYDVESAIATCMDTASSLTSDYRLQLAATAFCAARQRQQVAEMAIVIPGIQCAVGPERRLPAHICEVLCQASEALDFPHAELVELRAVAHLLVGAAQEDIMQLRKGVRLLLKAERLWRQQGARVPGQLSIVALSPLSQVGRTLWQLGKPRWGEAIMARGLREEMPRTEADLRLSPAAGAPEGLGRAGLSFRGLSQVMQQSMYAALRHRQDRHRDAAEIEQAALKRLEHLDGADETWAAPLYLKLALWLYCAGDADKARKALQNALRLAVRSLQDPLDAFMQDALRRIRGAAEARRGLHPNQHRSMCDQIREALGPDAGRLAGDPVSAALGELAGIAQNTGVVPLYRRPTMEQEAIPVHDEVSRLLTILNADSDWLTKVLLGALPSPDAEPVDSIRQRLARNPDFVRNALSLQAIARSWCLQRAGRGPGPIAVIADGEQFRVSGLAESDLRLLADWCVQGHWPVAMGAAFETTALTVTRGPAVVKGLPVGMHHISEAVSLLKDITAGQSSVDLRICTMPRDHDGEYLPLCLEGRESEAAICGGFYVAERGARACERARCQRLLTRLSDPRRPDLRKARARRAWQEAGSPGNFRTRWELSGEDYATFLGNLREPTEEAGPKRAPARSQRQRSTRS